MDTKGGILCIYGLKKSLIIHWWVAKFNLKMAFVNILARGELSEDLFVVGYINKEK